MSHPSNLLESSRDVGHQTRDGLLKSKTKIVSDVGYHDNLLQVTISLNVLYKQILRQYFYVDFTGALHRAGVFKLFCSQAKF